jgi:metallo-beta-lactamase family protein
LVKIFGEEYPLRAEVATISGLSAHAGQDLLITYARAVEGRARRIILVHGEQEAATALREQLAGSRLPLPVYPELGQTLEG